MPFDVTLRNPGTGFDVALGGAPVGGADPVVKAYVGGVWQPVAVRVHGGGAWPSVPVGAYVNGAWAKSVPAGPPVLPPSGVSYSDTFDGTGDLLAPWFTHYNWAIQRQSGAVRGTHAWGDAVYTSEMTTSDMWVQSTIDMRDGTYTDGFGPAARFYPNSDGTYEGYALRLMRYDNANLKWELERNGVDVISMTQTAIPAPSGTEIVARLEAVGNQIRCYLNGSLVGTYVDPNPLSRRTGGLCVHDNTTVALDWSAGDATAVPLAADNFNRTESPLATSSSGHTWVHPHHPTRSHAANGSVAYHVGTTGESASVINVGTADCTVRAILTTGATGNVDVGLCGRLVDSNTYLLAGISIRSGVNRATLYLHDGTYTQLAGGDYNLPGSFQVGTSYLVELYMTGAALAVKLDGTTILTHTLDGAQMAILAGATSHGLRSNNEAGNSTWEAFAINP